MIRTWRVALRNAAAGVVVGALAVLMATPTPAWADAVRDGQWYVDFLQLRQAHQITKGKGVIVAVVDTGVGQHPDLSGNVLPGQDMIGGFSAPDGRYDMDGHGTAMAGLVGAHGRVLGVAPEATILPLRSAAAVASSLRVLCPPSTLPSAAVPRSSV
ncbi:S8 family serine peptidase [Luedemannella flava]